MNSFSTHSINKCQAASSSSCGFRRATNRSRKVFVDLRLLLFIRGGGPARPKGNNLLMKRMVRLGEGLTMLIVLIHWCINIS
jgi:hypothetical protein